MTSCIVEKYGKLVLDTNILQELIYKIVSRYILISSKFLAYMCMPILTFLHRNKCPALRPTFTFVGEQIFLFFLVIIKLTEEAFTLFIFQEKILFSGKVKYFLPNICFQKSNSLFAEQ